MTPTLNTEEVNALMSAIESGKVAPAAADKPAVEAIPYDLTSRDRIIRGQMPTLDAINEQIASMVGTGLGGRTRLNLRVSSTPATLLKFMDVNSLLAPPAAVCVMRLGAAHDLALAILEPGLADTLLAAALGDRRSRPDESHSEPRRELTSVERLVLKRLLGILTDAMAVAWAPVLPFRPEVIRFEADPRLAVIAPPNEAAVLSTFEISGGLTGRLHLAIPLSAVESAKKSLTSPPRVHTLGDTRFTQALEQQLEAVTVELCAVFGRASLPVSRLLSLDTGDVLTLDTDEGSPLQIWVEGRPKLTGLPRTSGGNIAVVVQTPLSSAEPQEPLTTAA